MVTKRSNSVRNSLTLLRTNKIKYMCNPLVRRFSSNRKLSIGKQVLSVLTSWDR